MIMKLFDDALFNELSTKAKSLPRLRANHNVHDCLDERVQRLFIAIEPGSYVQPHRHAEQKKWEFFMLVRGRLAVLLFDDEGRVLQREELSLEGPVNGFEIPPNCWHCVVALESGSIFFEVKQGPYTALLDKDFAAWAPQEGESGCYEFVQWLALAQPGDMSPVV